MRGPPPSSPRDEPADDDPLFSEGMTLEQLCKASADAIFAQLFALLNRDHSGYADQADVVAALQCKMGSAEMASRALERVAAEGHIDAPKLRTLIEGTVAAPAADPVAKHGQMVRLLLAVVRDFERRATERGEFVLSAQARECAAAMRNLEERRELLVLRQRQHAERELLMRQQGAEAAEFNRAWKQRMDEFSKLTQRAIEEMRARHENSVEQFLATNRPALVTHFERHSKERDALDSIKVLQQLSRTGEFATCEKYSKVVDGQLRRDKESALEKAEDELRRKLEVHRWRCRLEYKGLVTKCERIRSEHRGQWEDGLAKLVLAQKNKIADVRARHVRESKRAALAIRAALEPSIRPTQREVPHQNFALLSLSPRRKPVAAGGAPPTLLGAQWPPQV